jgi:hypothetical protein
MRATHQQIESVKDWVRYEWVVALLFVALLYAVGEGTWYDEHILIVAAAIFAGLSMLGVLIGMLFPAHD